MNSRVVDEKSRRNGNSGTSENSIDGNNRLTYMGFRLKSKKVKKEEYVLKNYRTVKERI